MLFLHLLIKIAQPMCSEPHPVPGAVPTFSILDLIYPSTCALGRDTINSPILLMGVRGPESAISWVIYTDEV